MFYGIILSSTKPLIIIGRILIILFVITQPIAITKAFKNLNKELDNQKDIDPEENKNSENYEKFKSLKQFDNNIE